MESSGGIVPFNPDQELQRPGLLVDNGTVYVAFGSHADLQPYHGWLLGYAADDIRHQTCVWCVTPNGGAGAIWQSGRGPASDGKGNIFVATGNGDFDGVSNWSQSLLKLSTASGLSVADWFTPADWFTTDVNDQDLGASGPVLLPGTSLLLGGGKDGTLYLLDQNNLGKLQPDNTQIIQSFQAATYGIFDLAVWDGPAGPLVYLWGWSDALKAYRLKDGKLETTPYSQNPMMSGSPYVGLAVSAHGSDRGTGVLWATTADYYDQPAPGALHAFDAMDVSRELWNSNRIETRDALGYFAKFAIPTVAHGRVYVPTFSNEVVVYGLLEPNTKRSHPIPE